MDINKAARTAPISGSSESQGRRDSVSEGAEEPRAPDVHPPSSSGPLDRRSSVSAPESPRRSEAVDPKIAEAEADLNDVCDGTGSLSGWFIATAFKHEDVDVSPQVARRVAQAALDGCADEPIHTMTLLQICATYIGKAGDKGDLAQRLVDACIQAAPVMGSRTIILPAIAAWRHLDAARAQACSAKIVAAFENGPGQLSLNHFGSLWSAEDQASALDWLMDHRSESPRPAHLLKAIQDTALHGIPKSAERFALICRVAEVAASTEGSEDLPETLILAMRDELTWLRHVAAGPEAWHGPVTVLQAVFQAAAGATAPLNRMSELLQVLDVGDRAQQTGLALYIGEHLVDSVNHPMARERLAQGIRNGFPVRDHALTWDRSVALDRALVLDHEPQVAARILKDFPFPASLPQDGMTRIAGIIAKLAGPAGIVLATFNEALAQRRTRLEESGQATRIRWTPDPDEASPGDPVQLAERIRDWVPLLDGPDACYSIVSQLFDGAHAIDRSNAVGDASQDTFLLDTAESLVDLLRPPQERESAVDYLWHLASPTSWDRMVAITTVFMLETGIPSIDEASFVEVSRRIEQVTGMPSVLCSLVVSYAGPSAYVLASTLSALAERRLQLQPAISAPSA